MAKVTIHELEEILSGGAGIVEILPDGSVVVSEELTALRADLKALAVLLQDIHAAPSVRRAGWVAYENRVLIGQALARSGVKEILNA